MVFSVRKHLWNRKVRLRLRRDRFGPGICNGAMRSETLQFCICAVRTRVLRLRDEFKIVVIGAVRNVRRYSDYVYVMSLFVVYVHVHVCMHVNVTYITRKHTYMYTRST